MKIGDLVKCITVDNQPVGLVVEKFVYSGPNPNGGMDLFYVLIPHYDDPFPIRVSQMEFVQ